MKAKIFGYILFFLPASSAYAQQNLVDSITKELQQPMPDSNRAMSMMRLAIDYEVVDTALAFKAYRNAIKFAEEKKLYYQLGRTHENQAFLFSTVGNYPQTIKGLDTAITNYQRSDHPKAKEWEASAYNAMANVLKAQNEFQQAIDYYLKAVAVLEKLGLPGKQVVAYCNISTLFGDMRERDKQEEYAIKAVTTAKQFGTRDNVFMAYIILVNYYSVQEDNKSAKKFLDSARVYFDAGSNIDNIDIMFSYYLISAQVFKKMEQADSAFYFFQQSFEISKKYNYGYGKAESQIQMGAIAILQEKYADAEKYLLAGIEDAKAINYFGILDDGYKYLSDVYAVTGKYKQAYEFFQMYKETNDSVINMESKKYATELEKKYETEKKDKQIKLQEAKLERRRVLGAVLIGSVAIILIISLLAYRNYRQERKLQRQRISELEKEKQLASTEAVLKGEEQERTRLAKDLHDGLGGMMSGIKYSLQTMKKNLIMTPENQQAFERSMDMLDSSINEMRRVAHNMMPEALVRFGLDTALVDFCDDVNKSGALQVNYQSIGIKDLEIDQTTAITIYRVIQELINNTMKHASATTAIVQVTKTNDLISITVEDDGKGFNTAILNKVGGIGWDNIRSRVGYLKGKLDVQSEPGKGTSVHIELNT